MIKKIFRTQAINYQQERFSGQILLSRPLSLTILTIFFAILIIAIILFFIFFSYTRKAHVKGVLLPIQGIIKISAVDPGIVKKIFVHEGQEIVAGELMFLLSNERFGAVQGKTDKLVYKILLERKINLIKDYQVVQEQLQKKKLALQKKIQNFNSEEKLLNDSITVQKEQIELFEDIVLRYLKALKLKTISYLETNEKKSELLVKKMELIDFQKQLGILIREKNDSIADLEQLRLQETREYSSHKRDVSLIEREIIENKAQKKMRIEAPQDGIISTMVVAEGQSIAESNLMTTLIPKNAKLEANLFISSNAIGFVKVGMPVLLKYQSYPYQKFGQHRGTIHEISKNTLLPNDLSSSLGINIHGVEKESALYRVKVQLNAQNINAYGEYYTLKTGMELEASILLENRKLYQWVLEPLYSLRGNM